MKKILLYLLLFISSSTFAQIQYNQLDSIDASRIKAPSTGVNGQVMTVQNGKVVPLNLPSTSNVRTYQVASQAAMLALTKGNANETLIAIRSDNSQNYICDGNCTPTVLAQWQVLASPSTTNSVVLSGQVLTTDVNGATSNQSLAGLITTATQSALNDKQDELVGNETVFDGWCKDTNQLFSGNYNDLTNKPTLISTFTNDAGYITSASAGGSHKYAREWHCDQQNGNDTTGDGSEDKPFKTLAKAIAVAGSTGEVIVLHAGYYSDVVTANQSNLTITAAEGSIAGSVLVNAITCTQTTGNTIRIEGLQINSLIKNSGCNLYLKNCLFTANGNFSCGSSGGYVEMTNCDLSNSGLTVLYCSATQYVYQNCIIGSQAINATAGSIFTFRDCMKIGNLSINGSSYLIVNNCKLISVSDAIPALQATGNSYLVVNNTQLYDNNGDKSSVTVDGSSVYSFNNLSCNISASSITGTNLQDETLIDVLSTQYLKAGYINMPSITLDDASEQIVVRGSTGDFGYINKDTLTNTPFLRAGTGLDAKAEKGTNIARDGGLQVGATTAMDAGDKLSVKGGKASVDSLKIRNTPTATASSPYYYLVTDANGNIKKEPIITTLSPVLDVTVSTPPASPAVDDAYIVPTGATGAWSGNTNKIATWTGAAWSYYTPATNDKTTVQVGGNAGATYTFSGTTWGLSTVKNQLKTYNWLLTDSYKATDLAIYNDVLYQANGDIPASTPFLVGTSGATWKFIGSAGGFEGGFAIIAAATVGVGAAATVDLYSINLPSKGSWEIKYSVRTSVLAAGRVMSVFVTDAANNIELGSKGIGNYVAGATVTDVQGTVSKTIVVNTSGAATYKIRAESTVGGTIPSDATAGWSTVTWKKVANFLPVIGQQVDDATYAINSIPTGGNQTIGLTLLGNGNLPVSSNTITLKANTKYKLRAFLSVRTISGQSAYYEYKWTDASGVQLPFSKQGTTASTHSTDAIAVVPALAEVTVGSTPLVVKLMSGGTANIDGSGAALNFDYQYSSAEIQQVGTTATLAPPASSGIIGTNASGQFISTSSKGNTTNIIQATTTNPTKGTAAKDINAWVTTGDLVNVQVSIDVRTGAAAGSGDYILTLPNGYSFDTNLYQTTTNAVQTDIYRSVIGATGFCVIPGTSSIQVVGIIPYDATRYRVLTSAGVQWSNGYYALTQNIISFTFSFRKL